MVARVLVVQAVGATGLLRRAYSQLSAAGAPIGSRLPCLLNSSRIKVTSAPCAQYLATNAAIHRPLDRRGGHSHTNGRTSTR